ncbi:S-adenosyl-L-methionine-dependent methyltransferase [Nemania diffusa]|nr:S-adenosyl-L-methionine-dependent methyltransferase [Nemania diffusa]
MADGSLYGLNESTETGIEQETDRLDFQHYFFHDVMNNELLPSHITHDLAANPSPRVCEIATGSAVWLRDLAKTLPTSAELIGLDFDASKFPRPEALPPNVKLGFGNAYEPFPEEFRNRFDVVHLRFFLFALKKDHGAALVQNLLSLLRPGGWLVWVETSALLASAVPPSEALFEFQKVYHTFATQAGLDVDMPLGITSYVRQAGLEDCGERSYNSGSVLFSSKGSNWLTRSHSEFFTTLKQITKGFFASGIVDGMKTQQDFDNFVAKLKEDMSGARKLHVPIVRAWGRKPS